MSATSTTGAPLPAAAETAQAPGMARARDNAAGRQHRDAFERALRERAGARHENEDTSCSAAAPDIAAGATATGPSALLRQTAAAALPQGNAAHVEALSEGARAAAVTLDATAGANAQPLAAVAGHADAAGVWEASVHEPAGVAIEIRATRVARAAGAQAAWTLTIASPTVDAAVLARHAPRLHERLRGRELTPMHVRIEREDEEAA